MIKGINGIRNNSSLFEEAILLYDGQTEYDRGESEEEMGWRG